MTFGDVFIMVALFLAVAITLWAGIVALAFIAPVKARAARVALEEKPGAMLGIGTGIGAVLTLLVIFASKGGGLGGFFAIVMIGAVLALALLGNSGLALIVSERIHQEDVQTSRYSALARAAGLMVMGGLFPVLGWFLAVLSLLASLGAGSVAFFARPRPVVVPETNSVPASAFSVEAR